MLKGREVPEKSHTSFIATITYKYWNQIDFDKAGPWNMLLNYVDIL